jgi:hypothetical protein
MYKVEQKMKDCTGTWNQSQYKQIKQQQNHRYIRCTEAETLEFINS